MRIDFFTCVVNGMPFIQHHLPVFEALKRPWHWHVYEGIARVPFFPDDTIYPDMHRNGLSVDGTSEYLDELQRHSQVTVYRVGADWDKVYITARYQEMLKAVKEPTLAWELDADEYWTSDQIETMAEMFEKCPDKTAAWFLCRCFVGPKLILTGHNTAGNRRSYEWKRVWLQRPGMTYLKHDPPRVVDDEGRMIFDLNPFSHDETAAAGLVFNHYAYVLEKQVHFKARRYAFKGAEEDWRRLQLHSKFPVPLLQFMSWLGDGTIDVAPEAHQFKDVC